MEMKTKNTERYLRYVFSEEEKAAIAKKLSSQIREKSLVEDDKKRVMSDFKFRLDTIDSEVSKLSGNYDSGYEMRNIKCQTTYDYKSGTKTTIRLDTKEIIENLKMTEDEMQLELEL